MACIQGFIIFMAGTFNLLPRCTHQPCHTSLHAMMTRSRNAPHVGQVLASEQAMWKVYVSSVS